MIIRPVIGGVIRPPVHAALSKGGGGGGPITIDNIVQRTGQVYTFTARRSGDVSKARSASFSTSGAAPDPALASDFGGAFPTGVFSFLAGSATATFNVTGNAAVQPE